MTLFGVTNSLSGKQWVLKEGPERTTLAITQQHNVPDMVARILSARGFNETSVSDFLAPSLRNQLPDPSRFKDMDKAAARVTAALKANEKIAIFGDYDVDGATSSALLAVYLRALGAEPIIYIPDRKKEGYGPNLPALEKLHQQGAKIVICVDCGITAFAPLEGASKLGLDVIVLDHHVAEPALPMAHALVNPNRLDEEPGFGQLAACGVTFLFLVALNRTLRGINFFVSRPEPNLLDLLDIVALGTVADVVPLTGLNRALVAQGLKVLAARTNIGLTALGEVAGLKEMPEAWHLGFLFGPRINAGGRVGQADLGVRLLTATSQAEAARLATQLDEFNNERKAVESLMIEQALLKAEAQANAPFIIVTAKDWHIGVIGIVAGRLKERFNKPTFVIAFEGGVGKGSGRSVKGFDLGAATIAARQMGLLMNGGGHAMAAGLTLAEEKLEAFHTFMLERATQSLGEAHIPEHNVDAVLSLAAATPDLIGSLAQLAPYGQGNPEPRLAFSHLRVAYADIVGENHVRATLTSREGTRLKAIAFRQADTPLGQALLGSREQIIHVTGSVRLNTWQGKSEVQLQLDDVALAN